MDDGDSHPASANFPQVNSQVVKHNLPRSLAAGYAFCAFLGDFTPGTRGRWHLEKRENLICF